MSYEIESHMSDCPHYREIDKLYSHGTGVKNLVIHGIDPANDSAKAGIQKAEMWMLFTLRGCNGPIDGSCPLLEVKKNSKTRKPFATLGRKIINLFSFSDRSERESDIRVETNRNTIKSTNLSDTNFISGAGTEVGLVINAIAFNETGNNRI